MLGWFQSRLCLLPLWSTAPARRLGRYVEEHGIDLVAMGTHGRTGVERYLLGSVAERLIRTSSAPVLTVRAERGG